MRVFECSRYIKTRAYSNATLCQNLKAIGEELSRFNILNKRTFTFLFIQIVPD